MKKTKISYWILTSLLAAFMTMSAIPDILVVPEAVAMFKHLGYPVYLLPFIGVAKLLGSLAILLPVHARIKEWAYAGLFFDLVGAAYSTIVVDGGFGWTFVLLPVAVLFISYTLFHKLKSQRTNAGTNVARQSNVYAPSVLPA